MKNSDDRKRIRHLDMAKGIGIFCIVIGHSYSYYIGNGNKVIPFLFSFHVPIFFIITGILYSRRDAVCINVMKKIRELIIPYFIWGGIYQLCLLCLSLIGGEDVGAQIGSRVLTILQLTSGAMWFLPTMFVSTILFQLSSRTRNKRYQWAFCIVAFIIGVIAPHNSVIAESLWRGLIGFSFITIGYYCNALFKRKTKPLIWALLLIVDVVLISFYGTADLARRSFGFIPLYLLISLLGCWLCISGCNYLELKCSNAVCKSFERLGQYSIVVLCTHQIILAVLQVLDYRVLNYGIQRLGELEGIIMAIIILIIIYLLLPVLIRLMGWSFGINS